MIGSDAGGLPEVVKHTETGFLLPVGDIEGMAARTIEILKDEEHRARPGPGRRAAARRRCSAPTASVSQYERFYEKVLAREPTADASTSPASAPIPTTPSWSWAAPSRARPRADGASRSSTSRAARAAAAARPRRASAEAQEAARILGVAHRESLGLPDARLAHLPEQQGPAGRGRCAGCGPRW